MTSLTTQESLLPEEAGPDLLAQCKLCQNINRTGAPEDQPEQRACFEAKTWREQYQPRKGSKATITLTCRRFSHVRSFYLRS